MTNEKELALLARQKATETFNALPFETRKNLANGYERLLEIELLLSKGDNLSIAFVKKRRHELEQWLLEWYKEQTKEQL